jgi:tRNA nucleotidyltransferase (CCA-adding enzyme)
MRAYILEDKDFRKLKKKEESLKKKIYENGFKVISVSYTVQKNTNKSHRIVIVYEEK